MKGKNVFVFGMHRSGTSAVAGLLRRMGLYFAEDKEQMPAAPDNPVGFWERLDVCRLNDEILAAAGGAWDDLSEFSLSRIPAARKETFERRIQGILSKLDSCGSWFLKDPRFCLTYPLWRPQVHSAVAVIVNRNPAQIARSLARRNGFPRPFAVALWEYYITHALDATRQMHRLVVSYEKLIEDPQGLAERLFEELTEAGIVGLRMPQSDSLADAVRAELFHERDGDVASHDLLTGRQLDLASTLSSGDLAPFSESVQPSETALEEMRTWRSNSILRATNDQLREAKQDAVREKCDLEGALAASIESLRSLEKHQDALLEDNSKLEQELAASRDSFLAVKAEKDREIDQLHQYLSRMEFGFSVAFSSLRWRLGNIFVRPAELALGRIGARTARDYIDQIAREYEVWKWEKEHGGAGDDPLGEMADEVPARAPLFRLFAQKILSDPVGSMRLFTFRKALYIASGLLSGDAEKCRQIHESVVRPGRFDPRAFSLMASWQLRKYEWRCGKVSFPAPSDPLVSIIVPAHNQFHTTMACLNALSMNTSTVPFEVLLADDCSSDETKEIEQFLENVTILRSECNLGFLQNCNIAARRAGGKYILFLNNDTIVEKGWLDRLVETAENNRDAGVIGPKLLNSDGSLQEAGGIIWKDGSGWNYGRGKDPNGCEYNYLKEVDFVSGACLMTTKELWGEIGGFDMRYTPAYYEDVDYAFAVRQRGHKVIYQPKSVVYHLEGVSHGREISSGVKKYQEINRAKFISKWRPVLSLEQGLDQPHAFKARDRSLRRKTVLFIDHYVPHFDQDAGSKSTYQYMKLLVNAGLNVKFMGDNHFPHEPYTSFLQQSGIEVLYGHWYAANWKHYISEHLHEIDYLFLYRPHIASKYLDLIKHRERTKVFYVAVDIHHLRVRRQNKVSQGKDLAEIAREFEVQETNILQSVDKSYFFSEYEVNYIKKLHPGVEAGYLPLFFYDDVNPPVVGFEDREGLFFVGGFRHHPNEDGIKWFLEEAFPLARRRDEGLHFTIAGAHMPKWLLGLRQEGVTVLGEISDADLERKYARTRLIAAPLRFGAGVKGKVVEGARHGIPVVTTSTGAEGIPGGQDFLVIEDSPEKLAEEIVGIYHDRQRWNRCASNGLEAIRRFFSEEGALDILSRDMGRPLILAW